MRILLTILAVTLLASARPSLTGNWRNQGGSLTLKETAHGLDINGCAHPYEGPEPGSSNFLLTRLTRTAEGYHLYSESRRTTQEADGPIRVLFQEIDTDYQLVEEGRLRVTTVWKNGTRRLVSEYTRADD